jgi:cobalt-zinc-cadmium efflux system outer membrane protein
MRSTWTASWLTAVACVLAGAVLAAPPKVPRVRPASQEAPEPVVVEPAEEPKLRLDDFVSLAEANSPTLTSASASIAAAQGIALQEGLYPNPRLDLFSPQLNGDESQYAGQLTQEFVTKGKLKLQRQAALRDVSKAHLAYLRARFDLVTEVRRRFYTVLAGQWRVEVLTGLVGVLQKSRDIADRTHKSGFGTRTDVVLLEIELQNAEVNLQNARTQLHGERRQLAAAIGQPEMLVGDVAGDLMAVLPGIFTTEASVASVTQHTNVLSAAQEIERSQIRLKRACVEPYPNVSFSAGLMLQASEPYQMGMFGVSLPIPVWNRNQGNIAAAHAEVGKAMAGFSVTQNELTKDLAGALARYRAAQQLVDRYEQRILPAAEEARKIIEAGYDQGEFDFLRVLQAQRTLVETNLGYVKAQEDRWSAAAEVANLLQLEQFP